MPWYLLVPLLLVVLVALAWGGGAMIAKEHTATSTIMLRASPASVWAALQEWQRFPEWRKDLKSVEAFTSPDGKSGWVEFSEWGRMPLVVERSETERCWSVRILDEGLPFGGTWTHRLQPLPNGGTQLVTTEAGHIKPAFFRLLAKFVFGYHKTLNDSQRALASKFGEDVTPSNS